jgi:hypothetical protein
MVSEIAERLEFELVAGRTFVEVLQKVGVTVALDGVEFGSDEEEQVVAKAVRRALVIYHPDRAIQKGLGVSETLEATETYKLLQNLHAEWLEEREALKNGLAHAAEEERRMNERTKAKAARHEARRKAEKIAAEQRKREAKQERQAVRLAKKYAAEAARREKEMADATNGVTASAGRAATSLEELKRQIDAFDDDLNGHMAECHAEAAARRRGVAEGIHRAPPSSKVAARREAEERARADAARQQEAEIARERARISEFRGDGIDYAAGGATGTSAARARAREGLRRETKTTERQHLWSKVKHARDKKARKEAKKSGIKKST